MKLMASLPTWGPLFGSISILKYVFFSRMSVHIKVKEKLLLIRLNDRLAKLFCVVDRRMQHFAWLQPLSIEVA